MADEFETEHDQVLNEALGSTQQICIMIAGYRESLVREGIDEDLANALVVQFAGMVWASLWSIAGEQHDE